MTSNDDLSNQVDKLSDKIDSLEEENFKLRAELSKKAANNTYYRQAFYEYKSPTLFMGLPLIHITQGINPDTGKKAVAKGIIAVGDISLGVFCIGGISIGIFSIGGISIGLLGALGGLAIAGLLAVGGCAIGGTAIGACAIGYYSLGFASLGYYVAGIGKNGAVHLGFYEWFEQLIKIKF